ncbi:protein GAMETE CELL DEFECTIVE 1, mitochondrial [Cucumis melo]|nr:protein GAMETE CELL DEFECTIVE 1, mitochondrial [Cucumis melo]XP_050942439.1 protein GAMETE CELL DEFECTIVE 1, mitochondrial [Cucumis melo]XP_050942440.1 protein GAMETE CELL DEFECTIVE 1, mitochondrial [Cucumis melo]
MQNLHNLIYRLSSTSLGKSTNTSRLLKQNVGCNLLVDSVSTLKHVQGAWLTTLREFSAKSGGFGGGDTKNEWDKSVSEPFPGPTSDDLGWDSVSSWSTGLTKEHFDGEAVGRKASGGGFSESPQSSIVSGLQEYEDTVRELEAENRKSKVYVEKWGERMREMSILLKQVKEPGARGSYLKDSEKAEMYRLHKENPEVYTIEKLAKDYRIMRQRVHAILWLKELEEEEEKKLGHPLDDSIELLLDDFPEFFKSHDREFHVASLPYKPDFKVMPEGWDGTTRDLDEVHYEISQKEDEMLYKEFVERLNFNKKKVAGEVFCHKYSRRRAADGWKFTVEKMGPRGKRGSGGGWKFVSLPDGSSRPLNEMEKMYVRRETPRHRRKILP